MDTPPNIAGLIVAAGQGLRAGGGVPKQFRILAGEPVLRHAARALLAHRDISTLQVVVAAQHREHADEILAVLADDRIRPCVIGGSERQASVMAGLQALAPAKPDRVLIHDAARPFLGVDVTHRVLDALHKVPAAIPCLPVVDALWHGQDGLLQSPRERADLWRAQTPQGFWFEQILHAHEIAPFGMADDAAIARAAGIQVAITRGDPQNIKLTLAQDFAQAERAFMDIRTGNGFDVHAFAPGDHVFLCGVRIPHDQTLAGHSDADVGLHAITDAIFGALAEGDIGQWFPPSDPQWKGAASAQFLEKAVSRAAVRGFTISHLDCTLICEMPKIGPHAAKMRAEIARICRIELDRVSVKATTTERLGFAGRKEGIAAMATATLMRL